MDRGHLKALMLSTLENEDQSTTIANFIIDDLGKEFGSKNQLEIPVNRREIKLDTKKQAKDVKIIKLERDQTLSAEEAQKTKVDVFERVSRKRSFNETAQAENEVNK